jgi:phosphate transport system substrate-binding protein
MRPFAIVAILACGLAAPAGDVTIVGYNDMSGIFAALNPIFSRARPGIRFHMKLKGTATAAPALTLGVSAFAPMGAEFSAMELETYRSFVGADPLPIRVAHCSLDPRALSAPVGIFVNRLNPIDKLTVQQVAHIFTTRGAAGNVTHWGQLGLKGEWAARPIHPAGIAEEAAAGLAAFMLKKMGGGPFTPGYEGFAQSTQVVRRVSEDPAAVGFASANIADQRVKLLAIAGPDGAYYAPTARDVGSGKYPYDRYLLVYLRRVPGEPLDPFPKEYLRLVLSSEGQRAIAQAPPHYLPLNAREVREELSKLELPIDSRHFQAVAESGGTESLLAKLNNRFARVHPDLAARLPRAGLPSLSLYGVTTGVSAIALMDRAVWPLEIRPFRQTYGYEPVGIRIGRAGYAGPGRPNPPGSWVNARNPLPGLTVDQVARIFTTGGVNGDISEWRQLGLQGAWEQRAIHLYGPRDDGGVISAVRHAKMSGLPLARRYEPQPSVAETLEAIADDPYGIALADFCDPGVVPAAVRMLPIAEKAGMPYAGCSYKEVLAGKYPLSPFLWLYVNRAPGQALEQFVKEYARLALSHEGQAIVASEKDGPRGYLPLTASEVAEELAKIGN